MKAIKPKNLVVKGRKTSSHQEWLSWHLSWCIYAFKPLESSVPGVVEHTVVTTHREGIQGPNDFRHCKWSQHTELLWKSFSSPKRTNRREGNTGETSLSEQAIPVWTSCSYQSCLNVWKGIKSHLRQVWQTDKKILPLYATLVQILIFCHIYFS